MRNRKSFLKDDTFTILLTVKIVATAGSSVANNEIHPFCGSVKCSDIPLIHFAINFKKKKGIDVNEGLSCILWENSVEAVKGNGDSF